jgi:hypothetical protein
LHDNGGQIGLNIHAKIIHAWLFCDRTGLAARALK